MNTVICSLSGYNYGLREIYNNVSMFISSLATIEQAARSYRLCVRCIYYYVLFVITLQL